ncbi:MAG: tetratricopeptide repeat protein [Pseudomonadota bacterium]
MTPFINKPSSLHGAALLLALLAGCAAPAPKPATAPVATSAIAPGGDAPAATPVAEPAPPSAAELQLQQAIAALNDQREQQAETLFKTLADEHPQLASPRTNLGILYFRRGQLIEAEQFFKQAIDVNAKDYAAHNYLGILYRQQGKFGAARTEYQAALAANPDYAYAHVNLAMLYDLYLGDLAKAREHYQRYQQLHGADDEQVAAWLADLQQRIDAQAKGKSSP